MSEKWLEALREKVVNCWQWHSPALQIGFQSAKPEPASDSWEIWAFPAVQEIVGGKDDGETVWSGFDFDVLRFLKDFEADAVDTSTRQPDHPTELIFEGKFRGPAVYLHICLEPPEDTEATEIVDFSGDGGPILRDKK